MRWSIGLVSMLALSACFEESDPNTDANDTSGVTDESGPGMDDGVGTTASAETTTGPAESSDSMGEESADADTTGCTAGAPGCACDGGECVDGHACGAGVCEPIPETCGNGMLDLDAGETCDDSNTDAADGCSALCQWERHCFVEHLGGTPTVGVRTFGLVPDGTLTMGGMLDVDGTHLPLPQEANFPGSLFNRAATRCRNLAYMAFAGSGSIAGIGIDDLDPVVVVQPTELSAVGVRELACDPIEGRLFAVRVEEQDVAVRSIQLEPDGSFGATEEFTFEDVHPLGARSARMALDIAARRVHVAFVGEGSSQVPMQVATLGYEGPLTEIAAPTTTLALNNTIHGIGLSAEPLAIVATGRRAAQPASTARLDLNNDGTWGSDTTFVDPPWDSRHNHLRLRLPGGPSGFALGGQDGVVIARFDVSTELQQVGMTIASGTVRTFTRAAFADRVLLVASTTGLQTYDLSTEPNDGQWPLLSQIDVGAPPTFESGAIIPCPG